ncbi:hypothetical protein Tco_0539407 [Tanacetum coccineum]
MTTYRTAAVDAAHNDEELRLNLDLLEERRERAAIREAKSKLKMTNITTPGSAVLPSDKETSSTAAMTLVMLPNILIRGPPYKRVATPAATDLVSQIGMHLRR